MTPDKRRPSAVSEHANSPLLKVELTDGVLQLTFSDPASKNSFSVRAAAELESLLEIHQGRFEALVFRAEGRVFCSGGNLSDYAAMASPDEGKLVNRRIAATLKAIAHLEVPTVCAVGGDCFGGGVELISAFDHIISAPHVFLGLWQRRIGLTFGWGGGSRLSSRLGTARVKSLALSATTFGAREGLDWGLIDELAPAASLDALGLSRAKELAALPKNPIEPLKAWQAEQESEIFEALWWNDEHRRVLQSRKPR